MSILGMLANQDFLSNISVTIFHKALWTPTGRSTYYEEVKRRRKRLQKSLLPFSSSSWFSFFLFPPFIPLLLFFSFELFQTLNLIMEYRFTSSRSTFLCFPFFSIKWLLWCKMQVASKKKNMADEAAVILQAKLRQAAASTSWRNK